MRVVFALLTALVGILLLFEGYRLARVVIPLLGFVAGLSFGGAITADLGNTAFLGTALGVLIGVVVGLIFAVLAYLYYNLAVIILVGSFGYWIGNSFILFLGFSPGLVSLIIGTALGVLFGLVALVLNAPKYLLIVVTGITGAIASVGSLLLLFNQIPLSNFDYAAAHAAIRNSGFWTIVSIALAALGIYSQTQSTSGYEFETWGTGHHYHHPPPTTHPHGA